LVNIHKKDIVTENELCMLIKALRADGINPEDLTFKHRKKFLIDQSNSKFPKEQEEDFSPEDLIESRKTEKKTNEL